jgi:hypothetical protein
MTEPPCTHGQSPHDRRCVTECFGASATGPQTMISRCMLCGAVRTYEVLGYNGNDPIIAYGPWQKVANGN